MPDGRCISLFQCIPLLLQHDTLNRKKENYRCRWSVNLPFSVISPFFAACELDRAGAETVNVIWKRYCTNVYVKTCLLSKLIFAFFTQVSASNVIWRSNYTAMHLHIGLRLRNICIRHAKQTNKCNLEK